MTEPNYEIWVTHMGKRIHYMTVSDLHQAWVWTDMLMKDPDFEDVEAVPVDAKVLH